MIQNEREYRITSAWPKPFERDVETLEHKPAKPGTHPKLHKTKINASRSQAEDLRAQLVRSPEFHEFHPVAVGGNVLVVGHELAVLGELAADFVREELVGGEEVGLGGGGYNAKED